MHGDSSLDAGKGRGRRRVKTLILAVALMKDRQLPIFFRETTFGKAVYCDSKNPKNFFEKVVTFFVFRDSKFTEHNHKSSSGGNHNEF